MSSLSSQSIQSICEMSFGETYLEILCEVPIFFNLAEFLRVIVGIIAVNRFHVQQLVPCTLGDILLGVKLSIVPHDVQYGTKMEETQQRNQKTEKKGNKINFLKNHLNAFGNPEKSPTRRSVTGSSEKITFHWYPLKQLSCQVC